MSRPTADREPVRLLRQYYDELLVAYAAISTNRQRTPDDVLARIEELVNAPEEDRAWSDAYQLEQFLSYTYSDEELETQLERRLVDLSKHGDADRYEALRDRAYRAEGREERESLLRTVMRNVQWVYRARDDKRYYAAVARRKTQQIFAVAMGLFATVLVVLHSEWVVSYHAMDLNTRTLIIGVSAGFMGACYSLMYRLRTALHDARLEDVRLYADVQYIVSRPLIGAAAAFVLFFLIQSHLLAGSLFPKLPLPLADSFVDVYAETSKMIVWGAIAGFAEYLVPSVLMQRARTLDRSGSAGTERPDVEVAGGRRNGSDAKDA